jgi:hypothetical protein
LMKMDVRFWRKAAPRGAWITAGIVDVPAFLFDFDRVRCAFIEIVLVRNRRGSRADRVVGSRGSP